jgi:hypothetical protein
LSHRAVGHRHDVRDAQPLEQLGDLIAREHDGR